MNIVIVAVVCLSIVSEHCVIYIPLKWLDFKFLKSFILFCQISGVSMSLLCVKNVHGAVVQCHTMLSGSRAACGKMWHMTCWWRHIFKTAASQIFPVCRLHRSVTLSCSTGRNLLPSAWRSTAPVNVTNQTTRSWFGSCPGERHRTSRLITSVSRVCQLFLRGAGTRVRG